jgi:class 3 adenylate cyclase
MTEDMSTKNQFVKSAAHSPLPRNRGLERAVRTLFMELWDTIGYDQRIRIGLRDALSAIHAVGLVVHIAKSRTTLSYFNPPFCDDERFHNKVLTLVNDARPKLADRDVKEGRGFKIDDRFAGIVVTIPVEAWRPGESLDGAQVSRGPGGINFSALVYERKGRWRQTANGPEEEQSFVAYHAGSTLLVLWDLIRHRTRRFAPFPAKISERYWKDAGELIKDPGERRKTPTILFPPWDSEKRLRTTTLSFDLRRSTFCMEQAADPQRFGIWLDQLVQILNQVGHLHGGVFDKFTGDGALVHFLETECQEVYKKNSVRSAMDCAVDMHRAMNIHLKRLRRFMHLDCRLLGAGVAMDVSDAFWSFDYRDNPITVGQGVVYACRLCDDTKAGRIRLTNIAYEELGVSLVERTGQSHLGL